MQYWMKSKKKRKIKSAPKTLLWTFRFSALFFHPFSLPFSISCSLGAPIVPQRSHSTSNVQKEPGWNFLDFIAHSVTLSTNQKGRKKRRQKRLPWMTLMTACYSHQVLDETSIYSESHEACWPDTQRDFSGSSLLRHFVTSLIFTKPRHFDRI
jgi:hypothetical protein